MATHGSSPGDMLLTEDDPVFLLSKEHVFYTYKHVFYTYKYMCFTRTM